jgi:hypothetical protein
VSAPRHIQQLSGVIGEARWNRTLAWHRIADDSRPFNCPTYWDDHSHFLESAVPQFALDRWKNQDSRVIVCVEKDAIMGMLSGLCRRYHVPIMSFHGQASDGGAVYELAKYLAPLRSKCLFVWCFYLGDFDTCGYLIDRVAFGDSKAPEGSDERIGKVNRLLWQLTDGADDVPYLIYERIGITPEDVMDERHSAYLLEANDDDSNFDRYVEDINEIEGFPQVEGFDSKKRSRGMVPATLGVDALGHEELLARTKREIKSRIVLGAWKDQRDAYKNQKAELSKLQL